MSPGSAALARGASLLALLLCACGAGATGDARHPDVILILCDTLRADALLDPAQRYDTPCLDAFAAEGIVFPRAFSHAPMTLPAHTALFSSRLPFETSVWNNGENVPDDLPLLAEWLRDHGYQTRAVISLATLNPGTRAGLARGFEHYDLDFWRMARGEQVAGRITAGLSACAPEKPLFFFAHYCDPHEPYDAHGLEQHEAEVQLDGEPLATVETADMSQWFRTLELAPGRHEFTVRSAQRFVLRCFEVREKDAELSVTWEEGQRLGATRSARLAVETRGEPSAPCEVRLWINDAPSGRKRNERYAREVAYVDRYVGRFLAELRAAGRYDDALIVFTSDHGESLGERNYWGHAQGVDDPELHVPLIVKLPKGDGRRAALAARAERLTAHVDLAPTLLELAGLPALPGASGTSLLTAHDTLLISESHRPEAKHDELALRDERFKLVYLPEEGRFLLYDLVEDPGEERDVFAARREERSAWPARLEALARAGVEKKRGNAGVDEATRLELESLGYGGER